MEQRPVANGRRKKTIKTAKQGADKIDKMGWMADPKSPLALVLVRWDGNA